MNTGNDGTETIKKETKLTAEQRAKLNKYAQLNRHAVRGQILLAGSSLTEQFPVNELLYKYRPGKIVYNRGVSGFTTDAMLISLEECVFGPEPSRIFINIGSNDLNKPDYREEDMIANYRRILTEITARLPGAAVYVQSFYPVNPGAIARIEDEGKRTRFSRRTNERVISANRAVAALASGLGLEYIDSYPLLLNGDVLDIKYTVDGAHLLPDAYDIILGELIEYFN